ncbi:MAG: DUF4416 family protein [Deltaproteobacteria bacterium]|nr:DUF4416 family protein [Deltaproteobacteria bacterium]
MSTPRPAEAVKLITSIFSSHVGILKDVLHILSVHYGGIDFLSAKMPFHYTDYYADEMGSSLERRFASFDTLIRPESLPDIKLFANSIEEKFSLSGKRRVNIDPGYVSDAHLILATGKAYSHRPYLRDGIYADLTLVFRSKTFQPLAWTYPDYRETHVINVFNMLRAKYLAQLKH